MSEAWRFPDDGLPRGVVVGECWARDGLQNEAGILTTEVKAEVIGLLVDAGFREIEATSFAHPGKLPQFADAEELLRRVPRRPGLRYRAICATPKAVDRAIAAKDAGRGVDDIAMILAVSEEYNRANVGMGIDENRRLIESMSRRALDSGHRLFGWVVTAFGCPIRGDIDPSASVALAKWWRDLGASLIGFGDTTGSANPLGVSRFYELALAEGLDPSTLVAHFHDTRGWGIANSLAALSRGISHVDASLGGIGGQARTGTAAVATGNTGNTCTEDLVAMLDEMGLATGISLPGLVSAGRRAETALGRSLRSNFILAGPVPHARIDWDPHKGIRGSG